MAGKKSTFTSMVLTLFLVTFVSASILGYVHNLTKEAIETSKQKAQNDAIKSILPEFDQLGTSYKAAPVDGSDSLTFFPAYNAGNELVGIAVKTYSKNGFGGLIQVMVGFQPDGNISGYQVLEHKETPGLGSKMDAWFKNPDKPKQNIVGKNPKTTNLSVSKDGGDIDAITASTISSRAFLESIRKAFETYQATTSGKTTDVLTHPTQTKGGKS